MISEMIGELEDRKDSRCVCSLACLQDDYNLDEKPL
jgi:hypothetical protein